MVKKHRDDLTHPPICSRKQTLLFFELDHGVRVVPTEDTVVAAEGVRDISTDISLYCLYGNNFFSGNQPFHEISANFSQPIKNTGWVRRLGWN